MAAGREMYFGITKAKGIEICVNSCLKDGLQAREKLKRTLDQTL